MHLEPEQSLSCSWFFVTHYNKTIILLSSIPVEASISLNYYLGSNNWISPVWKLSSFLLCVRLVQYAGVTISFRFRTATSCRMSVWLVQCILCTWKYPHIYLGSELIYICYVLGIVCLVTEIWLLYLLIWCRHIVIHCDNYNPLHDKYY